LVVSIQTVLSGQPGSFRGRVATRSGEWRWVEARAHALTDDRGILTGAVVNVRDVEEEVRTRQALADSEERFRLAMASAPIGMAVVGLDRHFVEVNSKLSAMTGYDEESLVQMALPDLLDSSDDDLDLRMRAQVLEGRLPAARCEHRLVRKDGSRIWIEHEIGLFRDHAGQPQSFVSTFADITETKPARERLAYQASHDMLTHL